MNCRFCGTTLHDIFLDLGTAPPSNAFLTAEALREPEVWYPLKLYTCNECKLVQVDEVKSHTELFSADYVYFSSYSRSWLAHAERFVAAAVDRLGLDSRSFVVEIASNDGYLLQYMKYRGIPCLGIEPTAGTAAAAREREIETVEAFFGTDLAKELVASRGRADLVVANNVLAHVPDINDFVAGMRMLLSDEGVLSAEFPHLYELVRNRQFDTVYHEHFSYLSLHTVHRIFAAHGLRIWDVEQLPTHGGSLRVWAGLQRSSRDVLPGVAQILALEADAGMLMPAFYRGFQQEAEAAKNDFLAFLLEQKRLGRRVGGYGAAAKGNTLMNFAGVRSDLIPWIADASLQKQGRFLPGSRIPVISTAELLVVAPDVLVVFPWNIFSEIAEQLCSRMPDTHLVSSATFLLRTSCLK